ncbi:hypothetical protein DFJ63DRAFT_320908 [Scheffersomyces coipomensis]|uniref:uncharacterized protein n=1 Tax=Scheffersomyces coipomensis TaxID=1788519 RepID=UPI00315CEA86
MSLKEAATLDIGFPILGAKFINNKTILVAGGGGEGNNGIPNKITAIKCTFKIKDPKRRLQRFREITLPSNEDSPQCLDTARILDDEENKFTVFVGCNQSSQLIKSMNINNNLRKYVYTKDEHLRFIDAAQLEEEISGNADEYPKIIRLSQNSTVGGLLTSTIPSSIYVFNPDNLELNFKYKPTKDVEIKDYSLSPDDDGKSLCYITSNSIETISTSTGDLLSSSTKIANIDKELKSLTLSKVRFIDNSNVIISASVRGGKGAVLLQYNIHTSKIIKQKVISKAFNNIVAIDISLSQNLIAIASNDLSLTLVKLDNFQLIKTFKKLHPFAITSVSFSPNGSKLATGSAANTLHIFRIPQNYAKGKSTIGTIFQYLLTIIIVAVLGIYLQTAYENGQLQEYIELSKEYSEKSKVLGIKYGQLSYERAQDYGLIGFEKAQEYGLIGFEKAQEYGQVGYQRVQQYGKLGYKFIKDKINGDNVEGDDSTKQYFTMDEWIEASSSEIFDEHNDVYISNIIEVDTETETTATTETTSVSFSSSVSESELSVESQATLDDEVEIKEVTKDIEDITSNNPELDTESFFEESSNYIETVTNSIPQFKEPEIEVVQNVTESSSVESIVSESTINEEEVEIPSSESSIVSESTEEPVISESTESPIPESSSNTSESTEIISSVVEAVSEVSSENSSVVSSESSSEVKEVTESIPEPVSEVKVEPVVEVHPPVVPEPVVSEVTHEEPEPVSSESSSSVETVSSELSVSSVVAESKEASSSETSTTVSSSISTPVEVSSEPSSSVSSSVSSSTTTSQSEEFVSSSSSSSLQSSSTTTIEQVSSSVAEVKSSSTTTESSSSATTETTSSTSTSETTSSSSTSEITSSSSTTETTQISESSVEIKKETEKVIPKEETTSTTIIAHTEHDEL